MADIAPPLDDVARRAQRARDIREFAEHHLAGPSQDIFEDMLLTICRLSRDQAGRGDLKLLARALAELRYGLKVFAPYRGTPKISIFGSSRTPEDHADYEQTVLFSRLMCANNWMVITGAGDGIMKAGHGGAGVAASFGVAIRLPFEQKTNTIIADDPKLVNFRYFFTRKLMFMKEASAVALFPGGFGTQDEGFEALTLVQTGKAALIPIVMCEQRGGNYWLHWRRYVENELLGDGMISPQDMDLFFITDDASAAVAHVLKFYRVFHSMRYVGDELVLRIKQPLSAETIERLNDEFGDLLRSGRIRQTHALAEEAGEFPNYPRIVLEFDRRSIGRLRRMVDAINDESDEALDDSAGSALHSE